MKKALHYFVVSLALIAIGFTQNVQAAGKITLNPSSSSITEGQSRVFSITLDSPIGTTLSVSITSSNPESLSITPSTVTYTAGEWAQTKTFAAEVLENGTYGDSKNVLILAKATSGSAYYNGYTTGVTMHVTDTTVPGTVYDPQDPPDNPDAEEDPEYIPPAANPATNKTTRKTVKPQANQSESEPFIADLATVEELPSVQTNVIPKSVFGKMGAAIDTAMSTHARDVYILIGMAATTAVIVLFVLYKRSVWWRRQRTRHSRWYYRHRNKIPFLRAKKRSVKTVRRKSSKPKPRKARS